MFVVAQSSGSGAIAALVVIAAGLVLGSLAAALARTITSSEKRPEALQASSGAIATLFFSVIVIIALVIALGIVNEAALTKLSEDVVSFLPKVLSATIVLIVGNIIGAFLEAGVARSLGHVSPAVRDRVPMLLKVLVTGFAVVIAANQLGVDTTIISIAVAAIFFTAGLSAALLAGLGGQDVATQIAAGRALRRELTIGDSVKVNGAEGEISVIGSTSTQITGAHKVTLVPNVELLHSHREIVQAVPTMEVVDD